MEGWGLGSRGRGRGLLRGVSEVLKGEGEPQRGQGEVWVTHAVWQRALRG